jgi:hypothetical protein
MMGGQRMGWMATAPSVGARASFCHDLSARGAQMELEVEKMIFELNGDMTGLFSPAEPPVFGRSPE